MGMDIGIGPSLTLRIPDKIILNIVYCEARVLYFSGLTGWTRLPRLPFPCLFFFYVRSTMSTVFWVNASVLKEALYKR